MSRGYSSKLALFLVHSRTTSLCSSFTVTNYFNIVIPYLKTRLGNCEERTIIPVRPRHGMKWSVVVANYKKWIKFFIYRVLLFSIYKRIHTLVLRRFLGSLRGFSKSTINKSMKALSLHTGQFWACKRYSSRFKVIIWDNEPQKGGNRSVQG